MNDYTLLMACMSHEDIIVRLESMVYEAEKDGTTRDEWMVAVIAEAIKRLKLLKT